MVFLCPLSLPINSSGNTGSCVLTGVVNVFINDRSLPSVVPGYFVFQNILSIQVAKFYITNTMCQNVNLIDSHILPICCFSCLCLCPFLCLSLSYNMATVGAPTQPQLCSLSLPKGKPLFRTFFIWDAFRFYHIHMHSYHILKPFSRKLLFTSFNQKFLLYIVAPFQTTYGL